MDQFPLAYIGYAKNSDIRSTSTSGGICQVVSEWILMQEGIVSGIQFDSEFNVVRTFITNKVDLQKINKSKYVQARQGNSYREIKNYLQEGKLVLFVGTPCEVMGLISFLGNKPSNLYCIDFVCLGVPSEKVWHSYCNMIKENATITEVDFKDKRQGWKNFTFHIKFNNGTELNEAGRQNMYMKLMIEKVANRPACYHCKCRNLDRVADITVADAWGAEKLAPELFDDKGTSAIMVNTEQGESLICNILDRLHLAEVDVYELWKGNQSAWKQYEMPEERKVFFRDLKNYGFKKSYVKLRIHRIKLLLLNKFKKIKELYSRNSLFCL